MNVTANPFQELSNEMTHLKNILLSMRDEIRKTKPKPQLTVYMTRTEVSKYIKVSRQLLGQWHNDGTLVAAKVGSHFRYKKSDVDAYIEGL